MKKVFCVMLAAFWAFAQKRPFNIPAALQAELEKIR